MRQTQYVAVTVAACLLLAVSETSQAKGGSGGSSRTSGSGASHSHVSGSGTGSNSSSHSVSGYHKKDGTYVQPHHATNPNDSKRDNYSSKPNVNTYTGKSGTKDADK
jgi:hypothetical protein